MSPTAPRKRRPKQSPAPRDLNPEISPETLEAIGLILKECSGFSLEGYKDKCVKRRIHIRVHATRCRTPEDYLALLAESPAEREHLLRVLTINVSHFFRNPLVFQKLAEEILPELLASRAGKVRLMSIGCAGGEEPYSLAIMLREQFAQALDGGRFSILGTDVDPAVLEGAMSAIYHPSRLAEVSPELLSRWFTREGARFHLNTEIGSLVDFELADLNDPKPLKRCDLILCRNVLIYFDRNRQEAVLNGLADALQKGGVLVLGQSETLTGTARQRFQTVCAKERIYRVI